MRPLLTLLLLLLTACAPRGMLQTGAPAPGGTVHDVWVANFRPTDPPAEGQRSPPRPNTIRFERNSVSIPPNHKVGQIEWPDGAPSGLDTFVTIDHETLPGMTAFAQGIARADRGDSQTTLLYVHGFNYTHGEAVYQTAQLLHDFGIPSPGALFSWPSAATPVGYLYDRDSVLIARDQLEKVIIALTRTPGRKLEILGHSMGNLLIMETLRQIEISGSVDIRAKIAALIMVSPDIDGELFYAQAKRLKALPETTVIMAARQDRALRLSALLTGRSNRLGSVTDRAAVRDLPITIIDTSGFAQNGNAHAVPLTSPAAIAVFRRARENPDLISGPPERVIDLATLRELAALR